jgi:hypothetical protein
VPLAVFWIQSVVPRRDGTEAQRLSRPRRLEQRVRDIHVAVPGHLLTQSGTTAEKERVKSDVAARTLEYDDT